MSNVTVINQTDGYRDYPLKDGTSLHLLSKRKGREWPVISTEQVSEALLTAEKKGLVRLEPVSEPSAGKSTNKIVKEG